MTEQVREGGSSFRIVAVGPFAASAGFAVHAPSPELVRFRRGAFDEAMSRMAPHLVIDVPEPLGGVRGSRATSRLDLTFSAMRMFRPDVLLREVEELRTLVQRPPAASKMDARSGAPTPASSMTTPSVGSSLLDDLLDGMAGRASSEPEQTSSGAAGESPSTPSAPSPQPTDPASRLLASIVTHPEIRRLERAWRGLSLLVERCSAECGVVVDAVHAEPEDVEAVLEGLYRRSLERASSGAEPVDLVIIAHALGPAPRDLERLSAWAEFGERLGAPVVIEALPTALGFDDVASIGRTRRRLRSDSDPRAVALRAVAARDASRWSMLVMNGLVGRPRHTGDVPRQLPRPAPPVTLHENEQLLLSPVWAIAAIAARSVERTGWPCALTGTNHGLLRDLPVHTLEDGAAGVATPLEALVDADSATEAALAGVTLLASVKNADSIVLSSAPMLYRGAIGASGTSPSASLGLADQFFAGRVGRAVSELAAAIPATSAPEAVEQVAAIAFAQLFAGVEDVPEISASVVAGTPPTLEVTVHPRGFFGVRLDEVGFAAPLA